MVHKSRYSFPLATAFLYLAISSTTVFSAEKVDKPDLSDIQNQIDEIEPLLKDPDTGLGAVGGKLDGLLDYASTNEADNAEMSVELESILTELSTFKSEILAAVNAAEYLGPQITETTYLEWFYPDDMAERTMTFDVGPEPKRVSLRITGSHWVGQRWYGWEQYLPDSRHDNWSVIVRINGVTWRIFTVNNELQDGYLSRVIDLFEDKPISGTITLDYKRTLSDTWEYDLDPFIITFFVEE